MTQTKTRSKDRTKTPGKTGDKRPRGLSIHLEAFERALSRQGVDLRRHQVLAILAEGSGARNAHLLEAASKEGDLDARRLKAAAPITTPDGTRLLAWRDPAGGMIALGGPPCDRFIASPWGGLVDLVVGDDAPTPKGNGIASITVSGGSKLYVGRMETRDGAETAFGWSEDEVYAHLGAQIRPLLHRVGADDLPEGATDREVVRRYYDRCEELDNEQYLDMAVHDVAPPTAGSPATTPAATPAFPDTETREYLARHAANAKLALTAYAAATGGTVADGRSTALALLTDLAHAAEAALEVDHGEDERTGAPRELARALKIAMLERLEWHGEVGTDDFEVEAVYDETLAPAPRPPTTALDAAVEAYAKGVGGRWGMAYGEDRVAAEQDLTSDLAHGLWALGEEPRIVFAEALYAVYGGTESKAAFRPYLTWDGHAYAEAERPARAPPGGGTSGAQRSRRTGQSASVKGFAPHTRGAGTSWNVASSSGRPPTTARREAWVDGAGNVRIAALGKDALAALRHGRPSVLVVAPRQP